MNILDRKMEKKFAWNSESDADILTHMLQENMSNIESRISFFVYFR